MYRYSISRGINRFLEAQKREYATAHQEISEGKKRSHWIWYIYPQIKGLGMSYMDSEYSIKSIQETIEYIGNQILYVRLVEMTNLLLDIKHNDIKEVMWYPDDLKLRSCMTLFYAFTGNKIFEKVIDKFYNGEKDLKTIMILKGMLEKEKNKISDKNSKILEKNLNAIEKEEKIKLEKKKEEEKKILREKERQKEKDRQKEYKQKTLDEYVYLKKVIENINQNIVEDKTENQNTKLKKESNLVYNNNIAQSNLYNQEHKNLDKNYIENKNQSISNEDNKYKEKENSNLKQEIKEPLNSIRKQNEMTKKI